MGRNSTFHFRRFDVENRIAGMKVGTDSVLLGAWTRVIPSDRFILDAGTGSGLLALMIAQRANPTASITAVEIDPDATAEAARNFISSPWPGMLTAVNADWNQCVADIPPASVQLIISNPPYFTEALRAPDPRRATARHQLTLSFESLIISAADLLAPDGRLSMVSPAAAEPDITYLAEFHRLAISRLTRVIPVEGKPAALLLWELIPRGSATTPAVISTLTLRDSSSLPTPAYVDLTADYYTHLK
ncbi:MAG: methyltransferase [Muribaculaceae bacterium]|nr:methyltransferase [Muribaculaceae bacterium]